MPRANSSVPHHRKHRKIVKLAKGYRGSRSKLYVNAKDAVEKALQYAYRDRRNKKRDFRTLWIARINAAANQHDISYSKFISGLKKAEIILDRKALAEIAMHDADGFATLIALVKA
ncbi:MAG: 50S ribosomal protein L20 [Candidatus Marinimicrobia bacterium]|jgi:large subunit ribosomal protein L20|nr:50S ribosomal protein L20 [Candidatus Neomarinimicrobiota bacterium]MCK9559503.1 50S ribosomal protein L20 [Candidatus Neomarinimicrobiota bacterium]MDD5062310.1 50S ribosomal protein L20 [Candidatus Neomarinimicrobiota bacterium]MDD5230675.1 50S ribosomal protein L20 [Candidatus Neomarinimicrobiota bacterium]MDD5540190.1 50S ribosomal protein L20 [Candidatus Neomarinimicrobiota bacterium]